MLRGVRKSGIRSLRFRRQVMAALAVQRECDENIDQHMFR